MGIHCIGYGVKSGKFLEISSIQSGVYQHVLEQSDTSFLLSLRWQNPESASVLGVGKGSAINIDTSSSCFLSGRFYIGLFFWKYYDSTI